jgi:flotillin
MGYRDDQNAQRLRAAQLEAELGEARRELAELRAEGAGAGEAGESAKPESQDQGRPAQGVALGVSLVALGLALAAATPLYPASAPLQVLAGAGAVLAFIGLLLIVVRRLLYVARPCEALVVAGRSNRQPDGSVSHLHVQIGGRVLRRPFIETVHTMDLRVMPVDLRVSRAFCRDGAEAELVATALVKVAAEPARLRRAVERFLDQAPAGIATVAQQTLEGVLRACLSDLTLEALDEDWLKTAELVSVQADDELDKLGLQAVGFWLTSIGDHAGRLSDRRRTAVANALRAAELEEHNQRKERVR